MKRNRLWLLAHQDDEVLGLHLLSKSSRNLIIYLTNGVRVGAEFSSEERANEARAAWEAIDINAALIFFGTDHALKDGALRGAITPAHLNELIEICQNQAIDEIVTLQLEGGHQDHDIVSIIAEEISLRLSLNLLTFPAYRALHKNYAFYSVMSSTSESSEKCKCSIFERTLIAKQAFNLMKLYRTQLTTWVGLGPFVIIKYLIGTPSFVPHFSKTNFAQSFPSKLLYVNRKKDLPIDYEGFRKTISNW